jgi:hypothetical protein
VLDRLDRLLVKLGGSGRASVAKSVATAVLDLVPEFQVMTPSVNGRPIF